MHSILLGDGSLFQNADIHHYCYIHISIVPVYNLTHILITTRKLCAVLTSVK